MSAASKTAAALLLHKPALADDTPSRHPCKIRIPSAQKRFMFDPYKAQVTLGLEGGEEEEELDSDQDDSVDDNAFDDVATNEDEIAMMVAIDPPKPVDEDRNTATTVVIAKHARQYSSSSSSSDLDHSMTGHPHAALQKSRGLLYSSSKSPTPAPLPQDERPLANPSGAHYTSDDGCYRMISGNVHHVLVRFKFTDDIYVVPPCDRHGLTVGDLVVVNGDRGENIGQVAADVSDMYFENDSSQKPILRRALNKDRKKYYHARRKDALASKAAQQIAHEHGLSMHVLDAEFQADLGKLTIYYRAVGDDNIEFKELQRGLYKQFRCRIWIVNWDEDEGLQLTVQRQLRLPTLHMLVDHSSTPFGTAAVAAATLSSSSSTSVPLKQAATATAAVMAAMAAPQMSRAQPVILRRSAAAAPTGGTYGGPQQTLPLGAATFTGLRRLPTAAADVTAVGQHRVLRCY